MRCTTVTYRCNVEVSTYCTLYIIPGCVFFIVFILKLIVCFDIYDSELFVSHCSGRFHIQPHDDAVDNITLLLKGSTKQQQR